MFSTVRIHFYCKMVMIAYKVMYIEFYDFKPIGKEMIRATFFFSRNRYEYIVRHLLNDLWLTQSSVFVCMYVYVGIKWIMILHIAFFLYVWIRLLDADFFVL